LVEAGILNVTGDVGTNWNRSIPVFAENKAFVNSLRKHMRLYTGGAYLRILPSASADYSYEQGIGSRRKVFKVSRNGQSGCTIRLGCKAPLGAKHVEVRGIRGKS
jgi:hypothetical protein